MKIDNYSVANRLLGDLPERPLPGQRTALVEIDDPITPAARDAALAIRYHDTAVLVYLPDGSIVYNHGGWVTVTTMSRMNDYGPDNIRVRQHAGRMFIRVSGGDEVEFEGFAVRVLPDGQIEQLPSFEG